jgi:hypothetical protein
MAMAGRISLDRPTNNKHHGQGRKRKEKEDKHFLHIKAVRKGGH